MHTVDYTGGKWHSTIMSFLKKGNLDYQNNHSQAREWNYFFFKKEGAMQLPSCSNLLKIAPRRKWSHKPHPLLILELEKVLSKDALFPHSQK